MSDVMPEYLHALDRQRNECANAVEDALRDLARWEDFARDLAEHGSASCPSGPTVALIQRCLDESRELQADAKAYADYLSTQGRKYWFEHIESLQKMHELLLGILYKAVESRSIKNRATLPFDDVHDHAKHVRTARRRWLSPGHGVPDVDLPTVQTSKGQTPPEQMGRGARALAILLSAQQKGEKVLKADIAKAVGVDRSTITEAPTLSSSTRPGRLSRKPGERNRPAATSTPEGTSKQSNSPTLATFRATRKISLLRILQGKPRFWPRCNVAWLQRFAHKGMNAEIADIPTYWFALLDSARDRGDFQAAARAKRELERLGVRVTFAPRHRPKTAPRRKGPSNAECRQQREGGHDAE